VSRRRHVTVSCADEIGRALNKWLHACTLPKVDLHGGFDLAGSRWYGPSNAFIKRIKPFRYEVTF
jgi:hypothetical protein